MVKKFDKFSTVNLKVSYYRVAQLSHLYRTANINCETPFHVCSQWNKSYHKFCRFTLYITSLRNCSGKLFSASRIKVTTYPANHMHKLMLIIINKKFRFHIIDFFVANKCISPSPVLSSTSVMLFSYFSLNSVAAFLLMYEL